MPRPSHLVIAFGWLAACDSARDLPEWTPADHLHPASAVADDGTAEGAGEGAAAQPVGDPRTRAAATLFQIQCATCHGPGGRGDGPGRPPMAVVADLTDPAWQASRSDAEVRLSIAQGKGMMPAFGEQLGAAALDALVAHVRSLAAPTTPAPTAVIPEPPAPREGAPAAAAEPPAAEPPAQ